MDYSESLLGSDVQSIQQELYGISVSSHSYILREYLTEFRARHEHEGNYVFKENVDVLHTYCDPSGGGNGSEFAMVTLARVRDQYVIVGASSWHNDFSGNSHIAVNRMVTDHYNNIFALPQYRDAKVWLYYEAQSDGVHADQYGAYCRDKWPGKFQVYHGVQKNPNQVGVSVSEATKMAWTDALMEVMVGQSLWYASEFATSRVGDLTMDDCVRDIKAKIEDQWNRFTCDLKIPLDPWGKVKRTFGAKQGGQCDDVISCIAGCILQMKKRLTEHTYRLWCRTNKVRFV